MHRRTKAFGEGDFLLTQAGAAARSAVERYKLALALFREAGYRPGEVRSLLR